MAGNNGILLMPGATRRLSLRSETIAYELDINGVAVPLEVYCKGAGCPITALIAVDEALAALDENEPTENERPTFNDDGTTTPGTISIRRCLAKAQAAERTLRREMLQAVSVRPLAVDHANIIASDDGPWKDILVKAGWRTPDDVPAEPTDGDAGEGEAAGPAASTGRPDSPASASLTPAETP
jgi:hypothetical protein